MASVLDSLRKEINKKYEKMGIDTTKNPVVTIGGTGKANKEHFSLGSPSLDFMVYNKIPRGIFIEIAGLEGAGKTTLSFLLAKSFIEQEKRKPESERQHIMFVDAEHTFDSDWAKNVAGYDSHDPLVETMLEQPMGSSAEQILDDVITAVKSGHIGLVIFDSLVAIAGQQTSGESMEKKDMGGIAKVMSDFVRRNTGLFARFNTTFVGINGVYMDPSGYGNPEKIGGGMAWKRACSLRLKVKRGKSYDVAGKELKDTENGAVGQIMEVALLKTKFCKHDRRLGRCHIDYDRGVDILQDTIELAEAPGFDIIQEVSTGYFIVTDPETGEVLSDKIHGEKNIRPFFEEHLDIWRKTYDKVYEILSKTDAKNSISFENMLNIDVNELFGIDVDAEAQQ